MTTEQYKKIYLIFIHLLLIVLLIGNVYSRGIIIQLGFGLIFTVFLVNCYLIMPYLWQILIDHKIFPKWLLIPQKKLSFPGSAGFYGSGQFYSIIILSQLLLAYLFAWMLKNHLDLMLVSRKFLCLIGIWAILTLAIAFFIAIMRKPTLKRWFSNIHTNPVINPLIFVALTLISSFYFVIAINILNISFAPNITHFWPQLATKLGVLITIGFAVHAPLKIIPLWGWRILWGIILTIAIISLCSNFFGIPNLH